jgi:hypothetical protein
MVVKSATIEACNAFQSEEPFHFLAHEMSLFMTDHAHSFLTRRITQIPLTPHSMVPALKTSATYHALDRVPLFAIPIDVTRRSTLEARPTQTTVSNVVSCISTQRARRRLGFIRTLHGQMSHLATPKALSGNINIPIAGPTTSEGFAGLSGKVFGHTETKWTALECRELLETGVGAFGGFKRDVGYSHVSRVVRCERIFVHE